MGGRRKLIQGLGFATACLEPVCVRKPEVLSDACKEHVHGQLCIEKACPN